MTYLIYIYIYIYTHTHTLHIEEVDINKNSNVSWIGFYMDKVMLSLTSSSSITLNFY